MEPTKAFEKMMHVWICEELEENFKEHYSRCG